MAPKVSIIIPCYNAEKWIEQSIKTAVSQDYENIEVIVVDNESTDTSLDIINSVQSNHDFIVSAADNIYPNCWDEARQEGFRLMTGEYVLVMGADDYLEPDFISNCMDIILRRPDKILALQSPIRGIRDNTGLPINFIGHEYSSIDEFKKQCLEKCPVNTPTVIYNTSLYERGLLEAKPKIYGGAADYDMYCNLADNGIMIVPIPKWFGFNYRWHEGQATWKVLNEASNYDKMIQEYWRDKWKT